MKIFKTALAGLLVLPIIASATSNYTDISDQNWVKPYLDQIVADHPKALRNVGDFNPFSRLTRAEAAKLILNVADLDTAKKFSLSKYNKVDIEEGDWKYDILEAARYHKVMSGQVYRNAPKDLYYHPNKSVTRCEFAKMAVNALCQDETACQIPARITEQDTRENGAFFPFQETLKEYGAVSGEDFRCDDAIKRNEAIKVLAKLDRPMQMQKRVPMVASSRTDDLEVFVEKMRLCEVGAIFDGSYPMIFEGGTSMIDAKMEILKKEGGVCTYTEESTAVHSLQLTGLEEMEQEKREFLEANKSIILEGMEEELGWHECVGPAEDIAEDLSLLKEGLYVLSEGVTCRNAKQKERFDKMMTFSQKIGECQVGESFLGEIAMPIPFVGYVAILTKMDIVKQEAGQCTYITEMIDIPEMNLEVLASLMEGEADQEEIDLAIEVTKEELKQAMLITGQTRCVGAPKVLERNMKELAQGRIDLAEEGVVCEDVIE